MRPLVLSFATMMASAAAASAHASAEAHSHHGGAVILAFAVVGALALLVTKRRA